MPNWCTGTLLAEGPKEDIHRFLKNSAHVPAYYLEHGWAEEEQRSNPYFCFSGLVPIPEVILRKHKIQSAVYQKDLARWREACQRVRDENPGKPDNELTFPDTSQFTSAEYDQKAMEAWYDWSCKNWGTKWDISRDARIADNTSARNPSVRIHFATAWAPPVKWLAKATRLFPSLTFTLEYEEPGMCFAGVAVAKGGRLIRDDCHQMTEAEMRARHPDWDWDDSATVAKTTASSNTANGTKGEPG